MVSFFLRCAKKKIFPSKDVRKIFTTMLVLILSDMRNNTINVAQGLRFL